MGKTYDFIAINKISYENALNDAISAISEDNTDGALQILHDTHQALKRGETCAKKPEEIGS
jgi:hypothetical protein